MKNHPPFTAEAWMLVRILAEMFRTYSAARHSVDTTKTMAYLFQQYGREQLFAAIDTVRSEQEHKNQQTTNNFPR